MVGLATERVVVTEELLAESMKEMSVFKNFLDLACLDARTDSVEERIGLGRGIAGCLDRRGHVVRMDNHCVLN